MNTQQHTAVLTYYKWVPIDDPPHYNTEHHTVRHHLHQSYTILIRHGFHCMVLSYLLLLVVAWQSLLPLMLVLPVGYDACNVISSIRQGEGT